MTEWIDPRYAALVAAFRRQQDDEAAPRPLSLGPVDAPELGAGRGFVVERLND